jgi:hypothetical protein
MGQRRKGRHGVVYHRLTAETPNTKLQTSREAPNIKHQTKKALKGMNSARPANLLNTEN